MGFNSRTMRLVNIMIFFYKKDSPRTPYQTTNHDKTWTRQDCDHRKSRVRCVCVGSWKQHLLRTDFMFQSIFRLLIFRSVASGSIFFWVENIQNQPSSIDQVSTQGVTWHNEADDLKIGFLLLCHLYQSSSLFNPYTLSVCLRPSALLDKWSKSHVPTHWWLRLSITAYKATTSLTRVAALSGCLTFVFTQRQAFRV